MYAGRNAKLFPRADGMEIVRRSKRFPSMNYHRYIGVDVVNGPGTRCTLFVAGCEHRCPGCYNASTWPIDSGFPYTEAVTEQIIADLQDVRIPRRGLSLSGGDPLFHPNCREILKLVRMVKEHCPGKDIWLWTGYLYEKLLPDQRAVLEYVDVLIDGPFIREQADPALLFRGSANQRIIRLKKRTGFRCSPRLEKLIVDAADLESKSVSF